MTILKGATRGPNGDWIIGGAQQKVAKVANSYDWLGGTLPSWLYAPAGTLTVSSPADSQGYLQLTTGATSGDQARLAVNTLIDTLHCHAILFEVEGFHVDQANGTNLDINLAIAGAGANIGGNFRHDAGGQLAYLMTNSPAGNGNVTDQLARRIASNGEGAKRQNLGIMILTKTREIVALQGGRVVGKIDGGSVLLDGDLRAGVTVITREAASHYFRLSQVRLTVWHD